MLTSVYIAIALVAQTPATKVTVLDDSYRPAANATVNAVDSSGNLMASATTDSHGAASLSIPAANVPKGIQIQAIRQGSDPSQPTIVNWTLNPTQPGQLILLAAGTGRTFDIREPKVSAYHSPCCPPSCCCCSPCCSPCYAPCCCPPRRYRCCHVDCGCISTIETNYQRGVSVNTAGVRHWTDTSGKYHVDARLLSFDGIEARLQKTDGRIVRIEIKNLSDPDAKCVREGTAVVLAAR